MRRVFLFAASAAGALALASSAHATIVFCDGAANTCGGQGDTVHLDGLDNGSDNIVNGTVLNGSVGVIIQGAENITVSANGGGQGQAWVVAVDGGLTTLDFRLQSGFDFGHIEFDLNTPNGGGRPQPWNVTLTGYDNTNQVFTQTFTGITNNNFFNANATNGELISHVSFTTSTDLAGVGHIRITGVQAVPEPATWALMIMGFGGAGALLRRRRWMTA